MADGEIQFRIDLKMKVIAFDEKENEFKFELEPDPRRYEWREQDGKSWLYDKLDNLWIPEDAFFKFLTNYLKDRPIGCQRPQIDPTEDYVDSRLSYVRKMLTSTDSSAELIDKSDDFLNSLAVDKLGFAILSLDIVGSTHLSNVMSPEKYMNLISTVLFELSSVVPKFHGHVLKYTGDGIIAYFPAPSFIRMNDLAIDCAFTMHLLIYKGINLILKEEDYQPLDIRIGIDSGEAYIVIIGSPETKRHRDIIGSVVNLASKIQSLAGVGGIALGNTTLRNLHTTWREICEEFMPRIDWPYKDQDGSPYRLHRVVGRKRLKGETDPEKNT
ncbi:MAG TPA: adenylate/guanylate cyclase domain-containing protein [candidate division Zixibacteria bacterium]|jgi:class 3 adenylate cyclase